VGRAVLRQQDCNSAAAKSAIAARPKVHALRVWCAFAVLLSLSAVPVFSTVLPPLVDYPNHLARMHLLAEGGDAFYAVHWAVLPNLAEDLIVPPLARVLPLDIAAKLFLVMIFGLMTGGVIWLNRVASGGWRLWPLLSFLFLYNRILLWGFVNYLFGIGIALCGTALWLTLEKRRWWLRVFVSSVVAFACFLSHIATFGFYALVILGVEVLPAVAEFRARQWRALGHRFAVAAPQFVVPAALWFGKRDPQLSRALAQGRSAVQRVRQLRPRPRPRFLCHVRCPYRRAGMGETAEYGSTAGHIGGDRLCGLSVAAQPDVRRLRFRSPAADRVFSAAHRRDRATLCQSTYRGCSRDGGGIDSDHPPGRHRARLA
jgi:hypothetical protein